MSHESFFTVEMFFFRYLDNIVLQRKLKCLIIALGANVKMVDEHILRKRIECNLELDHVSKETGISAKLIQAVEQENKKPFSSVLSYKMTARKLSNYYTVRLNVTPAKNKIPSYLRSKIS